MRNAEPVMKLRQVHNLARRDRKSTRLNSSQPCNLVCRLLLEKKNAPHAVETTFQILANVRYSSHQCNGQILQFSAPIIFFFNDTATTEIYTLSYTTLFR